MGPEAGCLAVPWSEIIDVVEAALADGNDLWMRRSRDEWGRIVEPLLPRMVRVDAQSADHVTVALGELDDALPARAPRRDRHHQADPGSPGCGHNLGLALGDA